MNKQQAAWVSAVFIMVNSVAGLAGRAVVVDVSFLQSIVPFVLAVVVGGFFGARLGAVRYSPMVYRRLMATILLLAVVRLGWLNVWACTGDVGPVAVPASPDSTAYIWEGLFAGSHTALRAVRMLHKGTIREKMVLKALSSTPASRILAACISRPLSVKSISDATGIPLASAYRQVKALLDDGLMVVERSAMTPDGKTYDLYRSRVRRAVLEIESNGVHVSWEPNADVEDHLVDIWGKLGG